MRTLGIDLAAQDKKTAICAIDWGSDGVRVESPVVGLSEPALLCAMEDADWIGIDAPFGWPDAMVEAVHGYAHGHPWPETADSVRLRYRATDWFVHDVILKERATAVWPLSVSSDRIAVCAWRCAGLLSRYSAATGWKLDRVGVPTEAKIHGGPDSPEGLITEGDLVEVYPAAALALWGLPHKGYKTTSAANAKPALEKRAAIMTALEQAATWLTLPEAVRAACVASDDAFDGFISSLVARAAATGSTLGPPLDQRDLARREGWIHLPGPDSIGGLGPGAP